MRISIVLLYIGSFLFSNIGIFKYSEWHFPTANLFFSKAFNEGT